MRSSLLLAALALPAFACGNAPPTPGTVRARISTDLANVLKESKAAADGGTANLPGSALLGYATAATGVSSTTTARLLALVPHLALPAERGVIAADGPSTFDPDAAIQWLNDHLFTDQNYLGDGVYRVPPELACTTETVDSSGNVTSTIDPACVTQVTKADLRIRTEDDDGLHFWIQLDADHDEPLGILLRHDELAVTVNLDDAGHAMIALAEAFGDHAPNAALAGQITADLKILGTAHAVASLTFDRPLAIALADQGAPLDGPTATRFTSAAADVASVELDGNAPLLAMHLGLGETTAHLPDPTAFTDLDLAGATADAAFDGATLTLANVSLGNHTTTVGKGGIQAIAIDLDPNDGRSLSATLTGDTATGLSTITVSPRFDLHLAIDHAALGDTAPVYDVTRVQLDGSLRGDGSNQLEVLTGSLALTTTPAQYGFTATAGQCVTSSSVTDTTSLTSYTQYAVGTCH